MFKSLTRFHKKIVIILTTFISFNSFAEITFPATTFQQLDYGLYWFDYAQAEKAEPGILNNYYSPEKPTVIYIHGWQNGSVEDQRRETFNRSIKDGPNEDLSQYWLDHGYNVGILYWNQFADESEVKDAEAKIYSTQGPRNMRWKSLDGNYQSGPNKNVSQLLFESIRDNMQDFANEHFRIAGHSLGNQIAIEVSKKLNDAVNNGLNANLLPDRVALLDPFYSQGEKGYLNDQWTGEVARASVDTLKNANVIVEAYRSSATGSSGIAGDTNKALMNKTAFTELRPWNFYFWQIAQKHDAAVSWYFASIDFAPPQLRRNRGDAPSAATSDNKTRELMNSNYGARQRSGAYSATPSDDNFDRRNRL